MPLNGLQFIFGGYAGFIKLSAKVYKTISNGPLVIARHARIPIVSIFPLNTLATILAKPRY